jgi:hypothetical protein
VPGCGTIVSLYPVIRQQSSAYVSIRQHTSAYVSMRQHTSAYVSIRQHTYASGTIESLSLVVKQQKQLVSEANTHTHIYTKEQVIREVFLKCI